MIDPFLLQNKEIIERAYEHIDLMTKINNQSNNKILFYLILIMSLISLYILNKEKIELFIKNFKLNNTIKKKNNIVNEPNIEKIEDITQSSENNDENINEDDLSDFEY